MTLAPLTVVIPTSGLTPYIELLLDDLRAQTVGPESVHIVVNNTASAVPKGSWCKERSSRVSVSFLTRDHYYAKGVNVALARVETKYVSVINDDVRLQPTWIEAVMEGLERNPQYGSIASRVISLRDESLLDSCGDSIHMSGRATANGWLDPIEMWTVPQEVFSTSGCLATYHMEDVRRAGYLDESFVAYMEDVDLGFRLQLLGRPCLFWPMAEAGHIGGATRKTPHLAAHLAERNSILTVAKNMPIELAPVAFPEFVRGHIGPCSFEGFRSWPAWRSGWASALRVAPRLARKRCDIQKSRRVSTDYLRSIIKLGQPEVCHL